MMLHSHLEVEEKKTFRKLIKLRKCLKLFDDRVKNDDYCFFNGTPIQYSSLLLVYNVLIRRLLIDGSVD
jgi:hypothetical protein